MKNETTLTEKAGAEWEKGNLREALKLFKQAADEGDEGAQHNVGYFYDVGEGIPVDKEKALFWYKKAFENGAKYSCDNIGIIYKERGDIDSAKIWFMKGANSGDGDSALLLAKLYLESPHQAEHLKAKKFLKLAISSQNITEDSREEAQSLLRKLSK